MISPHVSTSEALIFPLSRRRLNIASAILLFHAGVFALFSPLALPTLPEKVSWHLWIAVALSLLFCGVVGWSLRDAARSVSELRIDDRAIRFLPLGQSIELSEIMEVSGIDRFGRPSDIGATSALIRLGLKAPYSGQSVSGTLWSREGDLVIDARGADQAKIAEAIKARLAD